jgi:hypothetical protein
MSRTDALRGGYVLDDAEQLQKRERQFPDGPPPQFRIIRRASKWADNVRSTGGWNDALDELEDKNLFRGRASRYGGMVLTYVGAEDMRRMLQKKNPDLFERGQRERRVRYMESLRDDFRGFARRKEQTVISRQNALVEEGIRRSSIDYDLDEIDDDVIRIATDIEDIGYESADDLVGLWGHLRVGLKPDLEGFGNSKLGLVFDDSLQAQHIEYEREEIQLWLRSNRLDTNLMQDRAELPHVSVYQLEYGLGTVAVHPVSMPSYIEFDAPQAHVNRNSSY